MVDIRISRDEHGRIIPRCGECPPPHPDMQFQAEDDASEIWQCPDCGFMATQRKMPPPRHVIFVDEYATPN